MSGEFVTVKYADAVHTAMVMEWNYGNGPMVLVALSDGSLQTVSLGNVRLNINKATSIAMAKSSDDAVRSKSVKDFADYHAGGEV